MEPLEWAQLVVTSDHVAIAHIVAEAEGGLMLSCLGLKLAWLLLGQRHAAGLGSALVDGGAEGAEELGVLLVGDGLDQRGVDGWQLSSGFRCRFFVSFSLALL